MKIKLERTLPSCPSQLNCTACQQTFRVNQLRVLLYSDRGLLIGDICQNCLQQDANEIQRSVRRQANRLMAYSEGRAAETLPSHQQALELLEISIEKVEFPTFYQRLLKHIEIFIQESQELEATRFNLTSYSRQRACLERSFESNTE